MYRLLEKHGIALCLAESDKFEVPRGGDGPVRLRAAAERGVFGGGARQVAERVRQELGAGRDVYVFFKHEDTPAGAAYAVELLAETGELA